MKKLVIGITLLQSFVSFAQVNVAYEVQAGDRIVLLKSSGNSTQGNSINNLKEQCKEISGKLLSAPKCNQEGYVDARYGRIHCFQICKF